MMQLMHCEDTEKKTRTKHYLPIVPLTEWHILHKNFSNSISHTSRIDQAVNQTIKVTQSRNSAHQSFETDESRSTLSVVE